MLTRRQYADIYSLLLYFQIFYRYVLFFLIFSYFSRLKLNSSEIYPDIFYVGYNDQVIYMFFIYIFLNLLFLKDIVIHIANKPYMFILNC